MYRFEVVNACSQQDVAKLHFSGAILAQFNWPAMPHDLSSSSVINAHKP